MFLKTLCLIFVFAGVSAQPVAYDDENTLESLVKLYKTTGLPSTDCTKSGVSGDGISFNFYTRERFLYNLTLKHIQDEILPAYYHVNKTTKILVHGWNQSSKTETLQRMVYDYLLTQDVNVITMDWSVYAKECSIKSVFGDVTTVSGKVLGGVIKALLSHGTNSTKFHLIGFSAGAHIAGVAGKMMHPQMIGRITALDPMGSYYDHSGYPKLQTGDAHLVDVIYTTHGDHASQRDFGHIVFYPEGGHHPQPGCSESDELCSVYKSISYFRRSIVTPGAYPAKHIAHELTGPRPELEGESSPYTPDNYMGEYVDPSKHGKYYVYVKALPSVASNAH